jgi:hypothetical protein
MAELPITILLMLLLIGGPSLIYMMWRNDAVFKFRTEFLHNESEDALNYLSILETTEEIREAFPINVPYHPKFKALPSYKSMFYQFWVLPISRFSK